MHAPAHHVDHLHGGPAQLRRLVDRAPVGQCEGVQDAPHDLRLSSGFGLTGPGREGPDPGGHVAWGQETRVVHVHHGRARRECSGLFQQGGQIGVPSALPPHAQGLLEEPQARDVAQVADGAVHPELVGEVGGPPLLGEDRSLQFDPDQRPGPRGDVGEVRGAGGDRHHRGRGVVRAHRHQRRPGRGADVPAQPPHHVPGFDEFGQQAPRGDPETLRQQVQAAVGPPPEAHVHQAGGGGVGQLGDPFPRQPVAEQVGDEQQVPGRCQLGAPGGGGELEERVEGLDLEAVRRVEVDRWAVGEDPFGNPVGAAVPVVHRVARQGTVGVEQAVVHRPGVDADRGQALALGGPPQSGGDPGEERQNVPVQDLALPRRDGDRCVGEPGHLLGPQPGSVEGPGDHPSAGGTQVDRRVHGHRPRPSPGAHRRKAAATPLSTGTWSPVVCDSSPAVSANTALATCSGNTSLPRMVRLA